MLYLAKKWKQKMNELKDLLNKHKMKIMVLLITIAGLFIRLISIDKAHGLWFDEMYCNYLASQDMPFKFFDKLYNEDFHAPLYFIILHFWIKIFGTSDIILRLFSCLCGVLAIPVAYLLGKQIRSEKFGVICSAVIALNSLHIYYSQEVKFYSLLFLLCSVSLLFLLRYNENKDKINAIGLIISNVAILYTFTVAIFYVALINLGYTLYLTKKYKYAVKDFVKIQLIILALYIPYMPFIAHHFNLLSRYFISLSEVFYFSLTKSLLTIQMWFSPVVFNLSNGVPVALKPDIALIIHYLIFAFIPAFICLFGLFKSLQKKDFNSTILMLNIGFIIFIFISAIFNQFAFIPRYILMAMPAVLIFSISGLLDIQNKKTAKTLIIVYLLINALYIKLIPVSAPKLERAEGYNSVAEILKAEHFTPEDLVSMPFAGTFLTKYINVRVLDSDFSDTYIRNKNNSLEMILDKNLIKKLNKNNAKEELKPYIFTPKIPAKYKEYLMQNVYNKLQKGHYFAVVVNANYYIDYGIMQKMKINDKIYNNIALLYILYTKMVSHTLGFSIENLKLVKIVRSPGDVWLVYIFQKK